MKITLPNSLLGTEIPELGTKIDVAMFNPTWNAFTFAYSFNDSNTTNVMSSLSGLKRKYNT